MSHQDKSAEVSTLSKVIKDRGRLLSESLAIGNLSHYQAPIIERELATLTEAQTKEIKERGDGFVYGGDRFIGQIIFGIKDNLEPIDAYITKIKNSPAYIAFTTKEA